eukprot:7501869-Lingulodinium_polyedra.AAC.1
MEVREAGRSSAREAQDLSSSKAPVPHAGRLEQIPQGRVAQLLRRVQKVLAVNRANEGAQHRDDVGARVLREGPT